ARQQHGHWSSTVTNAWGTLAVEQFANAFETTPVAGLTTATLTGNTQTIDWTQTPQGRLLDFAWPAQAADVTLKHEGSGTPWITIQSRAAIPLTAPLSSGYRITKIITPIEQQVPGSFKRGDLLRIRLAVEAQSDMTWVVVNDPIPAGASQLGSGMAR